MGLFCARRRLGWLVFGLLLTSCGKASERPEPTPIPASVRAEFDAAERRLLSQFLEAGFVVSLWKDGTPEHRGDALIFTGIALGALSCTAGEVLERALLDMIYENKGGLYRHPELADKVSLDGALGLYFGVSSRIRRCPEARLAWAPAIKLHREFFRRTGRLNAKSDAKLVKEFNYVLDHLAHDLGVGTRPTADRKASLEKQIAGWALGVKLKKAACFRANLGFLSLRALEEQGASVGRREFCFATDGMKLAHIDHWCGRDDLEGWIKDFKYNAWEFQLQRCPGWESRDGKADLLTPAVDLLHAIRERYVF
jgi:hypothetical protein